MEYYVCVLSTDDYLEGVLVLNENLKALNTKHEILCLINETISERTIQILNAFHIKIKTIPGITYTSNYFDRWNHTFDKINVFSLTEYNKVIYLDSDLLLLENIDDLFNIDQITMVSDEPYTKNYNSAVMVIKPNRKDYYGLVNIIEKYIEEKKNNVGDQNVINDYFGNQNIKMLDSSYNQMKGIDVLDNVISVTDITPPVENPKVIHYIYQPKLFMINDKKIEIDEYTTLYNKYLKIVRDKIKKET